MNRFKFASTNNHMSKFADRQGIEKTSPVAQEKTAIASIPNATIFLLISAGLIGLLGISRSRNNFNKKNKQ